MFLQTEDYKAVCDTRTLNVITQSDAANRQRAETTAQEEVASYLRSRYDMAAAFAATGTARNPYLVQITANIALYYMVHWLPQNMGLDARRELYDDAIAWLTKVQKGAASPDLPLYNSTDGTETDTGNPVKFGCMGRNTYDY